MGLRVATGHHCWKSHNFLWFLTQNPLQYDLVHGPSARSASTFDPTFTGMIWHPVNILGYPCLRTHLQTSAFLAPVHVSSSKGFVLALSKFRDQNQRPPAFCQTHLSTEPRGRNSRGSGLTQLEINCVYVFMHLWGGPNQLSNVLCHLFNVATYIPLVWYTGALDRFFEALDSQVLADI